MCVCVLTIEACGNGGRDGEVTCVGGDKAIEDGDIETCELAVAAWSVSHRA